MLDDGVVRKNVVEIRVVGNGVTWDKSSMKFKNFSKVKNLEIYKNLYKNFINT